MTRPRTRIDRLCKELDDLAGETLVIRHAVKRIAKAADRIWDECYRIQGELAWMQEKRARRG